MEENRSPSNNPVRAMRKMRKGKTKVKSVVAPGAKKTYAMTPKRPAKEDVPGHLKGGRQPVRTPRGMGMGMGMSKRAKRLKGVML